MILAAYLGIGIGMCLHILGHNKIKHKEFFVGTEFKELTKQEYIIFVILFSLFWPLRFTKIGKEHFQIINKETGDVLPL